MITDTHLGMRPLSYQKHLKMMRDYFYNFFIPLLKEHYEEGDILIHLGDLYDNRNHIPIDVLNAGEQIIHDIAQILPVHLIVGNHDIFNKSSNNINSPKSLRWIPNVNVYEETTSIEVNGKSVVLMPWIESKYEQIEKLKEYSGSDYLFCHSDLNGCRMHLTSVAHRNNNKIDVEEFSGYRGVWSGHIHIRQVNKNFTFIGSPYQMDRNDYGDQKGIYILDTNTDKTTFIENDYSPVFQKVIVNTEEDIESLENVDMDNYVDLEISNTLLIENRKVRRKLDKILENNAFSKVDYINDIDTDEGLIDEEEVKMDVDIKDLEDFVLEYIRNKEYSNEDFKGDILSEYENILKIYKSEYKFN